ncbi:CPBP family intramembrane glutamic endopeptidase [Nonomuraea sp. SYSU D8015]|uniref:CPBP family intramembrane glutamic endopeptidase n=1 Tax=Nonomuraea sp. SYSU D8015 TaxID=2593644 RepID=UPI0016606522|nr:CPBP family intramembrane glutamic endopeptidase [Nonomuraea sp. SYSU D8015]
MTAVIPAPPAVSRHRARVNFAIFAVVVAGGGWVFAALDRAAGESTGAATTTSTSGSTLGQGLWLLVPALTALALHFFGKDGAGPLGLTLRFAGRVRWFAFAVALYPAATALCVALATATGAATFSLTPAAGKPALAEAFAAALAFLLVKNLLEELIFRGYATRTAMALGLPGIAPHVLVGVLWAVWHLPLYLVWMRAADFAVTTSLPWVWFLPLFNAGIVAVAVLYGELRVRTGSIWPGVAMHTVSNALVTPLLLNGHLRLEGHADAWIGIASHSIASMVIFGGLGLLLHRLRLGKQGVVPGRPENPGRAR